MFKKRLLFLFFIIVSLILITYQQNNKTSFLNLRPLNMFFNMLYDVKHNIKNSITKPFKIMLLREKENERLRNEIAKLLKEKQRYQEIVLENKRLKKLLSIKQKEPRYITTATVIAKGIDQWSNMFILDKGSSDDIKKDMTAITHRGLVGKIFKVFESYSYLLLITNVNFSSSARLQNSRVEGIVSGTGFKKCRLQYIPLEENVEKGDIVITSGLDLLFPKGIPIGYVSKVTKKGNSLFQDIEIIPFEDTYKTEEVIIIKRQ